jgi:hypothetical protein
MFDLPHFNRIGGTFITRNLENLEEEEGEDLGRGIFVFPKSWRTGIAGLFITVGALSSLLASSSTNYWASILQRAFVGKQATGVFKGQRK